MKKKVFISHVVGWCAICGCPILDCGYDDDPGKWEHDFTCAYH